MLETVLEIIVYMVVAAGLGVVLGWVLRGALGKEQAELSDARAQLRKLKRARREQEAALKEQQAVPAKVSSEVVKEKVVAEASQAAKVEPSEAKTKKQATSSKTTQTAVNKTAKAKSAPKPAAKTKKKPAAKRKTLAEREADQAAARKSFAEVAARIGAAEGKDKLTKIYGVGKRYEEMLNDLGLSSFAQIAQLKKAEVRTLAAALGVLDDRLETEDWVGSAKKLAKESSQ